MLSELVVTALRAGLDKRSKIETKSCLVNNIISRMATGDHLPKCVLSVVCLPIARSSSRAQN